MYVHLPPVMISHNSFFVAVLLSNYAVREELYKSGTVNVIVLTSTCARKVNSSHLNGITQQDLITRKECVTITTRSQCSIRTYCMYEI